MHNLEPHHYKIKQCLCTQPKAGSACSHTHYRSAVLKWSSRRREPSRKFWLPMGTGEAAHLSTKEKEGCHVLCDELKDWRRPGAAGYSFPHKQTSKNKQFHPTEKEMGQRDKREGQTGVRKEWHLWQRALRQTLEEMRGWAEDNGVFMKGASDVLSPSFCPAGLVWILDYCFIFWSAWYLINWPFAKRRSRMQTGQSKCSICQIWPGSNNYTAVLHWNSGNLFRFSSFSGWFCGYRAHRG